jgi:hypothetical protein
MARTQYSLKIVKSFLYRGDPVKEFSNRYYFDGAAPADGAAWDALSDAVVALEKTIYYSPVKIIAAHGYGPSSEVAVNNKTYSQAGTGSFGAASTPPGDCAAVLRMATTKLSTKNHVVYCFSYFHGVLQPASGGSADDILAAQKTAMEAYGTAWLSGITVGARTYKRCTPDGHLTTGRAVDGWIGHRDFPR